MENKRLIDADALKKSLRTDKGADAVGHSIVKLLKVDNIIDETPTVDAVEVVRCKDCIYRHTRYNCQGRRMDFFCADGQRVGGRENG